MTKYAVDEYNRGFNDGYNKAKMEFESPESAENTSTDKCETEDTKILKSMNGEYVTYRVDYLLDHLAREVYLLESYRRWKESLED